MRSKLQRFQENAARENVIEPGKLIFEDIKDKWHQYFKKDHPLVLELGCGKGEYTLGLARLFPDKNYVGVDVKGARIWYGSQIADEEGLSNVAFLRTRILEIEKYVGENEASELWITFPDPRLRDRDVKRRLTSSRHLDIYKKISKPGSWVHLKTDNTPLFDFTLDLLQNRSDITSIHYTRDFYASDVPVKQYNIITGYEKRFLAQGIKIKYLQFQFLKA